MVGNTDWALRIPLVRRKLTWMTDERLMKIIREYDMVIMYRDSLSDDNDVVEVPYYLERRVDDDNKIIDVWLRFEYQEKHEHTLNLMFGYESRKYALIITARSDPMVISEVLRRVVNDIDWGTACRDIHDTVQRIRGNVGYAIPIDELEKLVRHICEGSDGANKVEVRVGKLWLITGGYLIHTFDIHELTSIPEDIVELISIFNLTWDRFERYLIRPM